MKINLSAEIFGRSYQYILENIDKTINIIKFNLRSALANSSNILRNQAINNVRNWAKLPGDSVVGGSISDSEKWKVNYIDLETITLSCLSEHAKIVEFGGELTGTTLVRMTKGPGYPIFKQQGYPPMIRKSFLIQQPMAYFRSAKDSPSIRSSMKNSIKKDIWKSIKENL